MDKYYKNQLFNYIIDYMFETNIKMNELVKVLQKEELINYFLLILYEFSSEPQDIRNIFMNNNPKNNNLNMMFKESAEILLLGINYDFSDFMNIFNNYLNFVLNSDDLSFIQICYNMCKQMIVNSNNSNNINNNELINKIQNLILELCFNCPHTFPYDINQNWK